MRRLVFAMLTVASSALLAACSTGQAPPAPEPVSAASSPSSSAPPEAPPAPEPAADGPCPYLDTDAIARANGQSVGEVRISAGEAPHPTCYFYRPDGDLQLTVRVYAGDPAVAKAVVDKAAPIDTSNPADEPAGWTGGYESTEDGAVYAVAKGGNAVVVTTNQAQSVKARNVAKDAIRGLGL